MLPMIMVLGSTESLYPRAYTEARAKVEDCGLASLEAKVIDDDVPAHCDLVVECLEDHPRALVHVAVEPQDGNRVQLGHAGRAWAPSR